MTEVQPKRKKVSLRERFGLSSRGFRGLTEEARTALIERESRALVASGVDLTYKNLRESGETALLSSIYRYFPDGLAGLQSRLKVEVDPRRPRGYWTDPKKIEDEARVVLAEHGDISKNLLEEIGRSDLVGAATRHYPGGLFALKDRLQVQTRKPRGYYTVEQIESDARAFVGEHGSLHPQIMKEAGYSSLSAKISQYPGGRRGLAAALGIGKAEQFRGPWPQERILEIAKQIFDDEGKISNYYLQKTQRSGLGSAVTRYYPGGWKQLHIDLGIETTEKNISLEQANAAMDSLLEEAK